MEREKYIIKAQRQLKSKHYTEVDKAIMSCLHNIIHEKVLDMHVKGTLDKETYRYLNDNGSSLKCGHLTSPG